MCFSRKTTDQSPNTTTEHNDGRGSYEIGPFKIPINAPQGNSLQKTIWYFQKILLACAYLAGGAYTTYCVITLLQDYVRGPIYTRVSLMINESISIPPTLMCMNVEQLTSQRLNIEVDDGDPLQSFYFNYTKKYFNEISSAKQLFLNRETEWPKEVILIVHQYLSIMHAAESDWCDLYNCTLESTVFRHFHTDLGLHLLFLYALFIQ